MQIYYVPASIDGCSLVQNLIPQKYINRLSGIRAVLADEPEKVNPKIAEKSDVLVLQRPIRNSSFQILKRFKGLKVVDIDDDLWNLEADNPLKDGWPPEKVRLLDLFIKEADLISTHSAEVCRRIQERFPDKVVKFMPPMVDMAKAKRMRVFRNRGTVRIGWIGSQSHVKVLEHITHALINIGRNYPETMFVFFGWAAPEVLQRLDWWRWEYYQWVPTEYFYQVMGSLDLDIALCPLLDNNFAQTRSTRKVLDCGMFRSAIIASDVGPFHDISDKFVRKVSSKNKVKRWETAIRELVENRQEMGRLKRASHEYAKQFDAKIQAKKWVDIYKEEMK